MSVWIVWTFLAATAAAQTHVGKPLPDFVKGDECLFCHRTTIGPFWQKNAHGVAVRVREEAPELDKIAGIPDGTEYFLGSRNWIRMLKKDGYGKFALWTGKYDRKNFKWVSAEGATWDRTKFADRCAGCHTTAVDASTKAFTTYGHDCYTCHGSVNLEHSGDTSLIWLSKKRRDDIPAIESICGSCHLRGGKSKSTGLPYPNQFVAGDKLLLDFEIDFKTDAEDKHVLRNVRDVLVNGGETGCLSCHQVHANSTAKHRRVLTTEACEDCHNKTGPKKDLKPVTPFHSALCEY